MGVEWVAGLMILVAVLALAGAAFLFFRESWLMQWLRGTAGFLLAGMALYLAFLAASLFSYQQVPSSAPLATLSFERSADQVWNVTVAEANGSSRVYELLGDLWQLDVRLLRYSGIGGIFGTAPSFQLERLSGRYLSAEDEAAKDHTDYSLLAEPLLGFDVWERASEGGSLFVTGVRSNVALVPAAEGAIYEVILGDDGLLALRAANSVAEDAQKSVGE